MARSDIGSLVNRSLGGRGNAVSVYSPTRRIVRPTGRFANAGTAQGILGGGPVEPMRVGTSSFGGAPARSQISQLPGWTQALGGGMPGAPQPLAGIGTTADRVRAALGGGQAMAPEEPGGFWGSGIGKALGTAVNNPVGRGVMAGLEALNYPRRIVQSSIQEVVDAVNGGDASFDDWTRQIGDESFGFDNMVPDTGNSFLDGLVGFGGDALMDPFTFIGGAGVWSGIAGRTARASTAATARSLGIRVGRLTVEETEERIARWGFSRFNNAARAELRDQLPGTAGRILDRGYHFKVPLTGKFFQVPGTAPVDWLMSRGAGRVRDTLSRSPLGGWMRYASNPNRMRDAVTTMVTRRPTGGLNFAQAAEVINWNNGAKLAERSFTSQAVKLADNAVKALGGGGGGRTAANDLFRTAERQGDTVVHGFFRDARELLTTKHGIHVPEFDGPYLPHYRLPEAHAIMEAGDNAAANDFKNLLFKETDLDAPAESALQRQLVAGKSITIAGKSYDLVDGTADELNRIWHQALPDVTTDLIDTDFASVAHRYIKGFQENVRTIGGIKKVLGSKAGLLHKLGDDSMLKYLSDDDIDMFASKLTAPALKNQRNQVTATLKQMRADTHKGITGVGGSIGVEMREAVGRMSTVSAKNKRTLDDALRTVSDLEAQIGVGKYHDRFIDGSPVHGPPGKAGTITREYDKARKVFTNLLETKTKRFNELEKLHGRLKSQASAEARRLETTGNVGATPIQAELRRVAAETAATAHDMEWAETIIGRLNVNEKAQGVINSRLGDSDFINLAVADNLSPKSPGSMAGADTPPPPVYVGPSPAEVSTDANVKTTQILGAADQQVAEVAARFEVQNQAVNAARERRWQAEINYGEAADTAQRALGEGRRYEATLRYEVDRTAGKPELLQRNVEYSERLEAFQGGELKRLQRDFEEAKRPIDAARSNFDVEARKMQQIRDEQMRIATDMDARRTDAPGPPLTAAQEATVRTQRRRLVRDRNKWQRTPQGVAHTKAAKALDAVNKTLEATNRRITEITGKGGRFFIDADGAMQPKFTTQERWALDLMEHRRSTLIPARNAAEARHNAAVETWQRLQRGGASLESSEVKAAQREVSATFKAWKDTQYAVRQANGKLTKIKDIPDLGAITQQTDELNQLLAKQASQQTRADELANEMLTTGQTLQGFEDSIAGIDNQLELQNTARRIAAEAPATPYGAQVAANHRAELSRLDQIETQFAAPRNWADPEELSPAPGNLGEFEGRWEDPDIRKALELVGRVDGRRRMFDDMDEAVDLANSSAAIRAAAEPFTVPPVGTPAHTAVMEFSPASRGGAMGAVDRAQTVVANTQRVLDRHIPELVEAGAMPAEFADELFRQRLDLDRALDVHALNPSAHQRADVTAKASELGRLTNFALRYKQALEGGNEASAGLASFLLAREFDDEATSLLRQIEIGNARLASPMGGTAELGYSRGLARLNERAVQLSDNIEKEIGRAKAGGDWNRDLVRQWSAELDRVQRQVDGIGQPANGVLDDAVDSHAAYALDDLRDTNDAVRIFEENRFVDDRMQWPVRRKDELTAAIPHREAEIQGHMMGQQRLEDAIRRARSAPPATDDQVARKIAGILEDVDKGVSKYGPSGEAYNEGLRIVNNYKVRMRRDLYGKEVWEAQGTDGLTATFDNVADLEAHVRGPQAAGSMTVRFTPYNPEGYPGGVAVMPLAQAEANLVANADVIRTLQHDLTNKQMQLSAVEGTIDERIALLERELSDVEVPPNPVELLSENQAIQQAAQREQRALDPGELETIASNQARVDRLNRGQPLPQSTVAEMREEVARLSKVRDDFAEVMDGDAAHIAVARDPEPFLRGITVGGGPISERSMAMLGDLVGPETAAAAKVWIHYLDEAFAGRTAATADELSELVTDAVATFGDNELVDRMRQRAIASLAGDGTVSLDEMRDEFTSALVASANRQRGETMRETLSMQSLFGTTYVDGPNGLQPRLIDAITDEPSHQLLTARLRSTTLDLMQRKGYDPRNALVDEVADLRTRLGRVETMRRGIDGNEEWMDVLLTGTPSVQARAEVRATLRAGSEALQAEERQLLGEGQALVARVGGMADHLNVTPHRGPPVTAVDTTAMQSELDDLWNNALVERWYVSPNTPKDHPIVDAVSEFQTRVQTQRAAEGIPPDVAEAMSRYFSPEMADNVNQAVRQGDLSSANVQALDAAFDHGAPLPGGVENLYRGVKSEESLDEVFSLSPGDTFVESGYASTSMDPQVAMRFGELEEVGGLRAQVRPDGKDHALFIVRPGAATAETKVLAGIMKEAEWLLPREAQFRVTAVREMQGEGGGRVRVIETEWIGNGQPAAAPTPTPQATAAVDPDRLARSLEHQKQLGRQITDTEDEMSVVQREIDRLDREAFEAERTYTERLDEAGMHLANARRHQLEAQVDSRAHEAHRKQLVRALKAGDVSKKTPAMRTALADLDALNQARRDLGVAPTPAAAAAPPIGPRPPTAEETLAGWSDIRTPTAAEVQAVVKMNADAKAAGTINWEWYAPHAVGSNPNRLGPIQLPAGTKAPPGYYATAAPVGPQKLANDLGIGGHVSTGGGVKNPLNAGRDLWNLGYRDAADLGGAEPADIINGRIPFQGAPPPAATVAAATEAAADQADIDAIDGYLTAYAEDLNKIEAIERREADLTAQIKQAERNSEATSKIIKNMLADGWKIHAKGIGIDAPEGYAINAGLAKAIENIETGTSQHAFWTFLDKYTAFFKTYATAKPGFHVRNALSATFMNLVDGVRIRDMYEGARLWRQYEREPNFLANADQRVRDAFDAVAASGAGGRYAEAGFGVDVKAGTKMYQRVMDNPITRWNQRLGSHVEGSARLAMALNTMSRGGNAEQAAARIAKFHFDYTEMSSLDRMARRFIPFWTFMSRNLPLQMEQMFTNPRMYLQYQNLKRNMGETADPATPGYWLSAGAFTVDKHAATREAPWYIAPDLPHLQAFEPLDSLARGEFDKALLSDINPLILAPTEALLTGKKAFSGANLEGYEETSAANPFVPLFNLITATTPLNLTARAGSGATVVDKRAAHLARSILPPWEFAERLLDPTGKRAGRTDETIYRALGVPVRQLNEDLRRTTRQSEYFDRRERHQSQADLARM